MTLKGCFGVTGDWGQEVDLRDVEFSVFSLPCKSRVCSMHPKKSWLTFTPMQAVFQNRKLLILIPSMKFLRKFIRNPKFCNRPHNNKEWPKLVEWLHALLFRSYILNLFRIRVGFSIFLQKCFDFLFLRRVWRRSLFRTLTMCCMIGSSTIIELTSLKSITLAIEQNGSQAL